MKKIIFALMFFLTICTVSYAQTIDTKSIKEHLGTASVHFNVTTFNKDIRFNYIGQRNITDNHWVIEKVYWGFIKYLKDSSIDINSLDEYRLVIDDNVAIASIKDLKNYNPDSIYYAHFKPLWAYFND